MITKQLFHILSIGLITTHLCNIAFGQTNTTSISGTGKYVKFIDSLNNLENEQNAGFMHSTADGIIKKGKEVIGGYGIYTLSNLKNDSVYRIQYHNNIDVNIYETWYFRLNKIVFATLALEAGENGTDRLYTRSEYYNNDQIIQTQIEKRKGSEQYLYKTNISLYKEGLKYLDDFKEVK